MNVDSSPSFLLSLPTGFSSSAMPPECGSFIIIFFPLRFSLKYLKFKELKTKIIFKVEN